VFRRVLALGARLLRLCLVTRAALRLAAPVTGPDGTRLTDHAQRLTPDDLVLGPVRCGRHAFPAPGPAGRCPLAAGLSWPAQGSADLRREWAVDGTTDESSRARPTVRERRWGVSRRRQALEPGVAEAGPEVTTVAAQPAEPTTPPPVATVLGVPAAGPGGPRVPPPTAASSGRVGQGPKRPKPEEAVVTGLSPLTPDPRRPQAGVAALRQAPSRPALALRPRPVGTERRAPVAGTAAALSRLAPRVAPRDGAPLQPRGALTAGAAARPPQVMAPVPAYALILDLMHATA
jgi:hypothetical protein